EGAFATGDGGGFKERFEAEYTKLFGRPVEGLGIEIASWSVKVETIVPEPEKSKLRNTGTAVKNGPARELFDPKLSEFVAAKVIARESMPFGAQVKGPAIVTESETSIIVPVGFSATMQSDGCVLIENVSALQSARVHTEAAQ
ncbi:MAG: hypothetical protein ACR2OR_08695, partial [Hyphomicrobiales bacterium]